MTIVDLDAPTPYTPWNNSKFYLIPAIASATLAVTRTELNASTNLTPQVTDKSGWARTGNTIESQSFSGDSLKLGGPTTLEDSSFTFRLSKTGTDIRDLLEFGDSAFIGVFPDGDTVGRLMNVFKTEVIGDANTAGISDASVAVYQFSVLKAKFNYVIP